MPPEYQAIFDEWSPPAFLTAMVLVSAVVYVRGWIAIRKTRPAQYSVGRLAAFLLGLATLWLAIGSPMDGFADALLSAHMVEHLLLMSFVPPLLLLGNPQVPLLRGLPSIATVHLLGPLFRIKPVRALGHFLVRPTVAWVLMNITFLGWHIPAAYDFALEHELWHDFEHICFLSTSILFWWPLIRPWPTSARYPGWVMIPYLVGADIANTVLSAFLAFCDRPVYSYYAEQPNVFHVSLLADQVAGAVTMWVIGSLVFLIPAAFITIRLLQQDSKLQMPVENERAGRIHGESMLVTKVEI
jgi:putative membrane protein